MFDLFTDPDRVKVQWRLIWLNLSAAAVNLTVFTYDLIHHRWLGAINLISGIFSGYVAWKFYKKVPEITRDQEQKILRILKGENG